MAAGQGFKTFVTGEVLTAGDVNGYLMQGINVFTNATARDAAITAPAEGQFAFTKDNNSLWYYDGAAWVASGATGDIEGVTAGVGISGGGTSGTVTVTNSMATAIDAKGDLVPGTGADTFARLAVGANDTVLTADSAEATGLKWATPAAIPPSAFSAKGVVLVGTGSGTYAAQTVGANGTVLTANSAQADGVEWATVAAGGMTSIASGSLGGSSITISSIPTTYVNLYLAIYNFSADTNATIAFRFNGVTSGVYGSHSTGNFGQQSSVSSIWGGGQYQKAYTNDGSFGMTIQNYRSSYPSTQMAWFGYTGADQYTGTTGGGGGSTGAVNSITIFPSSGGFSTGIYTLYGVK